MKRYQVRAWIGKKTKVIAETDEAKVARGALTGIAQVARQERVGRPGGPVEYLDLWDSVKKVEIGRELLG